MPFEYVVDGSTSQTHTGSNSTLLNTLTGKCKHLMPNTHRGWTGHCSNNQKNFWKNMQILIQSCHSVKIDLGNDHLHCGFGARRSHLTLHWMSAQGSVGFRWGTITGPYHANFSQVETQKFDPHWFYCLQWGCNNLFCQECSNIGSENGLAPRRRQAIIWINGGLVYWRMYASVGLNELMQIHLHLFRFYSRRCAHRVSRRLRYPLSRQFLPQDVAFSRCCQAPPCGETAKSLIQHIRRHGHHFADNISSYCFSHLVRYSETCL